MLILGHLGIGSRLARRFKRGLPTSALLLGTVLPDLVDKPLFYLGGPLGLSAWIPGTRTFGHTAIVLFLLSGLAFLRKSKPIAAVTLGILTHLYLDGLSDHFALGRSQWLTSGLFWPFAREGFPSWTGGWQEHLAHSALNPVILGGEVLGAFLLTWEFRSRKRSKLT